MSILLTTTTQLSPVSAAALLATAWAAAGFDWRFWRIPNALLAASAAAALMLALFTPVSPGLAYCLLGGLAGLALLLPFYLAGGMGAGDVKLLAVIGLYTGWVTVIEIALVGALIGGLWSIVLLYLRSPAGAWIALQRRRVSEGCGRSGAGRALAPLMSKNSRGTLPYGVVIAIGTTAVIAAMAMAGS